MRTFGITLTLPTKCDCCGQALPLDSREPAPGKYYVELPEGPHPTSIRLGDALKVTIGGGQIEVQIRSKRGRNRQWALMKHHNTEAFGHAKKPDYTIDPTDDDFGFYTFKFNLPAEFKPWYKTWWAELKFAEVQWGSEHAYGGYKDAHNPAKVSVRLLTLE